MVWSGARKGCLQIPLLIPLVSEPENLQESTCFYFLCVQCTYICRAYTCLMLRVREGFRSSVAGLRMSVSHHVGPLQEQQVLLPGSIPPAPDSHFALISTIAHGCLASFCLLHLQYSYSVVKNLLGKTDTCLLVTSPNCKEELCYNFPISKTFLKVSVIPSVGCEVEAPARVPVSGCSQLGKQSGVAALCGLVLTDLKKGKSEWSYIEGIHCGVNSKQRNKNRN